MKLEETYERLLVIDTNKGGINAENGFEFQYACALFDIVERYERNEDFIVCLESVDDYILIMMVKYILTSVRIIVKNQLQPLF